MKAEGTHTNTWECWFRWQRTILYQSATRRQGFQCAILLTRLYFAPHSQNIYYTAHDEVPPLCTKIIKLLLAWTVLQHNVEVHKYNRNLWRWARYGHLTDPPLSYPGRCLICLHTVNTPSSNTKNKTRYYYWLYQHKALGFATKKRNGHIWVQCMFWDISLCIHESRNLNTNPYPYAKERTRIKLVLRMKGRCKLISPSTQWQRSNILLSLMIPHA